MAFLVLGAHGLRAQNACSVVLGNTTITPPPANAWYGSTNCVQANGQITVNGSAAVTIQGGTAIYFLPGFHFAAGNGTSLKTLIAPVTQVAAPVITSSSGGTPPVTTVTIATSTGGAAIRYTTNGSVPGETAGTPYAGPFTIAGTVTINAIAYENGLADSQVASTTVTVASPVSVPTFSPGPGTYTTGQAVTLVTETPGATIHYTTDGSAPNAGSAVFSAPVGVTAGTVTIRAYATAAGMPDSGVATGTYTISGGGGGGGGATQTTTYTYDWMNHLSGVSMTRGSVTQTRTFVYDDAGRLTAATNPENGTVSYTYNANNTLQYKHDANGQDTVYTYDSKMRVTEIQRFPQGQNHAEDTCQQVTYAYDTNPYDTTGKYQYTTGRLAAVVYPVCHVLDSTSVSVTEMYSYHPAGAVTIKDLHIYKPWYNSAFGGWSDGWGDVEADYSYNGAGQVLSLTLPVPNTNNGTCQACYRQQVTYSYGYDGMGRPVTMADNNPNSNNGSSTQWVQNVSYDFAGRLTAWQRYTGTGNDYNGNSLDTYVAETLGYNVNSQVTSMSWQYQSSYFGWGSVSGVQYVYPANQNNGQIMQTVATTGGQSTSYQYDGLKRLISAVSAPGGGGAATWTETMQYDGFGNLTAKVLNGATTAIPVNAATNRLANAYYDGNGNMTSGAGATLGYDVANRIVSAAEVRAGRSIMLMRRTGRGFSGWKRTG